MDWQIILALVFITPIIVAPVLFIWYLNIGGLIALKKEQKKTALTPVRAIKIKS